MITIREFITHLKTTKAYTSKQSVVIDFISIYVNDGKVLKVILYLMILVVLRENSQKIFYNDLNIIETFSRI